MKHLLIAVIGILSVPFAVRAADAALDRAKLELVVEEAGEMLADANRSGSAMHAASYRYYFGLVYGCGTNLLARKNSTRTAQLQRDYMRLIEKDYDAYTKVENAFDKAAATGADKVHVGRHVVTNGSRHRAKRIANAEKMGDEELAKAIKKWDAFATQLKRAR